jgi:hypothetical protein
LKGEKVVLKNLGSFLITAWLTIGLGTLVASEDDINKEELFKSIGQAFEAQVSIGQDTYSKKEIVEILSPYFTDSFIQKFMDENVVEYEGKYSVLGSDFAPNYIPYFSYSDLTRVSNAEEGLVVYENFSGAEDAPVAFLDHEEAIYLKNDEGTWKIDNVLYEFDSSSLDKHSENKTAANAEMESSNEVVHFKESNHTLAYVFTKFFSLLSEWNKILAF